MRKQEEYNEAVLIKKLGKNKVTENFTYHKTIMTTCLLDSLIDYSAKGSTDYQIHHLIEAARLVYERSLYTLATKLLEKARKEASHYEKHYLLFEICNSERKLLKRVLPQDLKKALEANSKEKKSLWKKIETEDAYSALNDEIFALFVEHNRVKTTAATAQLNAIMQHPLLKDEHAAQSFDAKLKYHEIHALNNQLSGNPSSALYHRELMMQLWDKHPHMISEMPMRHRIDLSALLSLRHENGKYQGFEELIQRIENIKTPGNEEADVTHFREVYYLRQLYLLNNNKWSEALNLIPKIEQGLKHHEKSIGQSRLFNFWYNIAITYLICAEYKRCQTWVEKLLDISRNNTVRTDLRDFAAILLVILHYETEKYELVEFHLRNVKDRLKRTNKLHQFEKIVLQFLGKLISNRHHAAKTKEIRIQFLSALEQLSRQQGNQSLLGLDEIIIWAKQKAA